MPLPNNPHPNIAISIATTASAIDIRFDHPQRPVRLEAGQQTDFSRALISPFVP